MATSEPLSRIAGVDYQALFDSLPSRFVGFLPDDPLFTICVENAAHAKIAMVRPADVIGKPLMEVWPDTSEKYLKTGVSDLLESLRKVIRTGKPDSMETLHYDLPRPDGKMETRYWRVTHYPLFSGRGVGKQLAMIYQATEDITETVATSTTLTRTQKQLEEALSLGLIGTWQWDIKRDRITGGKNMAAMFGLPLEDAEMGVPLERVGQAIHTDDRRAVLGATAKALKAGSVIRNEYRTTDIDGAMRWLISRGHIERDEHGKAATAAGILIDISDRKQIENNLSYLAKASAYLSASLDYKKTLRSIARLMVPDIADWCGVEILDEKTHELQQVAVAHKDPAKVKWAKELRLQQGPQDLDAPGGVAEVIRTGKSLFYPIITDEMITASATTDEEIQLIRDLALSSVIIVPLKINGRTVGAISLIGTDGKRQFAEADLEMAEEMANRASLAMTNASLYHDVSKELAERTRLEEKLQAANEGLEERVLERTAELGETNLSLQRSNQELQDFAYVASHDLQEPLRKIQAFGNLLQDEYASELGEGSDYLSRMRSAAARMSALIEDILAFSRVTTKGRPFTLVNLRKTCEEVLDDLEIRINDTGARLEIGDLPTIHADATQMRQLLQNLVSNALKFRRKGVVPVIKITASVHTGEDQAKTCHLEVKDNGLGFDEKYLDRIFAVFQRLHNRESFEGTGIGLAVCRKIVERHGGSITAKSKLNKGSTFIITLPMRHKKGENLL